MRSDLVKWLAAPESSTQQKEVTEKRFKNTCKWLLQLPAFIEWKSGRKSFLWLHGKSGSGKSTLCSAVIEALEKETAFPDDGRIIYFYFDFRDLDNEHSFEKMLRSLVLQLSSQDMKLQSTLQKSYVDHNNGDRQLLPGELIDMLTEMVQTLTRVHIVIDALDECIMRDDVGSTMAHGNIETRLRNGYEFDRWKSPQYAHILDDIEERLVGEADGMFRWVVCQLDQLKMCLGVDEIEEALNSLPSTLDETYHRILNAIPSHHKTKTIRVLQLLIAARERLTINQLVDAVAVQIDAEPYFDPEKRIPRPEEVVMYCSSLVEVLPAHWFDERHVQLAHSSVKAFLTPAHLDDEWAPYFDLPRLEVSVATVCLCYTIHMNAYKYSEAVQLRWKFPFSRYSLSHCMTHAVAVGDTDHSVLDLALDLFLHRKEAYQQWWWGPYLEDDYINDDPPPALHAACQLDWAPLVRRLLEQGSDPNAVYPGLASAAHEACKIGNREILQLLIMNGADFSKRAMDPITGHSSTPFGYACRTLDRHVIAMILNHLHERDIAAGTWDQMYKEALWAACACDDQVLLQVLLTDISTNRVCNWQTMSFSPIACAIDTCKPRCLRSIFNHLKNADNDTDTGLGAAFTLFQEAFVRLYKNQKQLWNVAIYEEIHDILKTQVRCTASSPVEGLEKVGLSDWFHLVYANCSKELDSILVKLKSREKERRIQEATRELASGASEETIGLVSWVGDVSEDEISGDSSDERITEDGSEEDTSWNQV
ncbi:hypothetical protein LTR84_012798 [Exophiala bonariae]|uniref:Nephrocystin 3-like N-terminal domain-containing protein n=1 Tax=Exophiala bonariae TaxID=1690606 RepID=A0AAV9NF02_9EURO|nr:hypothetical protein LTR84_012798 [Exophiala bonariae]